MKIRELLSGLKRPFGKQADAFNLTACCYRLLSAVADETPDAIVVTNRLGIIQWVSPVFARLTGYSAGEIIGSDTRFLGCANHAPEFHTLMCRTIVAALPWQGDVWLRSKAGFEHSYEASVTPITDSSGSIGYFVAVMREPARNNALSPAVREGRSAPGGRWILIVDDEPTVVAFLKRALTSDGFRVIAAHDGEEALTMVGGQAVDLVIADLVMPKMEGLELIAELRRHHPSVPVVVISGALGSSYPETALALGARAVLAKPFTAARLLEVVHKTLDSVSMQ